MQVNMPWSAIYCVLTLFVCISPCAVLSDVLGNTSAVDEGNQSFEVSATRNTSNENALGLSAQNSSYHDDILNITSSLSYPTTEKIETVGHKEDILKDISVTHTYDVLSWLPKPSQPRSTVNLTILPILATLAFLIMLCLKGCTWFRESIKEKEQDSFEDDGSFMILQEGDKDYRDIDFRSDLSTPYDTYSSYMSFLRRNNNYDTVTSVRSLQGSRTYDTVTSYRSLIQQRLDNHNNDSVASYQAFLQRVKAMKDVDVQVELLDEKSHERAGSFRHSRRPSRGENPSPGVRAKLFQHNGTGPVLDCLLETSVSSGSATKEKRDVGVGNGVITKDECVGTTPKHHYEKKSPTHKRSNSPVKHRCNSSPVRRHCLQETRNTDHQNTQVVPRFRVSFVTDDEKQMRGVKEQNTHAAEQEKGKLSPTSIPSAESVVDSSCSSCDRSIQDS